MFNKVSAFKLLAAILAAVIAGVIVLHYENSVFKRKDTSSQAAPAMPVKAEIYQPQSPPEQVQEPSAQSNDLTIDISGTGNTLKIKYSKTAKMADDIDMSGANQSHEVHINNDNPVTLDITGVENVIYIDNRLKGIITVDDTGVGNKTKYM